MELIAGIDEAGRGPMAGPVVAAAVILKPGQDLTGITDSKKISEARREALYERIISESAAYCIARADVDEIDELNILHATMLAMQRAICGLQIVPELALIDGNRCPTNLPCRAEYRIKGDLTTPAISAASILAKVTRDREMIALDKQYPGYGFAKHKGYGTKTHRAAMETLGLSPVHRKSFCFKKVST